MKDIFTNAYFGAVYLTAGGEKAMYHYSETVKSSDGVDWTYHYLMIEPHDVKVGDQNIRITSYTSYVNINGVGVPSNLKCYPVSRHNSDNIVKQIEPTVTYYKATIWRNNGDWGGCYDIFENVYATKQAAELAVKEFLTSDKIQKYCGGFDYDLYIKHKTDWTVKYSTICNVEIHHKIEKIEIK